MLKAGSIISTDHGCFNLLLASAILVAITIFQKIAPILYVVLGGSEIPALDTRGLATTKSLAFLVNTSTAALSLLTVKTLVPNVVPTALFLVGVTSAGDGVSHPAAS